MVQPKTPPLSIRIPAPLLAAIDEMAERRKITRHAAILLALVHGEAADRGITPESTARIAEALAKFPRSEPTTGVEVMARLRNDPAKRPAEALHFPKAAYGSRLDKKPGKGKR